MGTLKQGRKKRERNRAVPVVPEVRYWRATGLEVRAKSNTDEIKISGQPIMFGARYDVHDAFGTFKERMAPGVARAALAGGADVRFLVNHEGLPLARTISGTLSLTESSTSVDFEARLDARQQIANDLSIAIERGDVSQMSCGFIVARDEWDEAMEDRTVLQFRELLDVSAVTYPASPTTSIAVAERMALEVPVESRARLRRMHQELRGGKTLSASRQREMTALLGGFAGDVGPSRTPRKTAADLKLELERVGGRHHKTTAQDLRRILRQHEMKT
jgi:HK97 family phage prohead protease